jgi:hypothetical protein
VLPRDRALAAMVTGSGEPVKAESVGPVPWPVAAAMVTSSEESAKGRVRIGSGLPVPLPQWRPALECQ